MYTHDAITIIKVLNSAITSKNCVLLCVCVCVVVRTDFLKDNHCKIKYSMYSSSVIVSVLSLATEIFLQAVKILFV